MTTYRSKLAPATIHHGDCLPILAAMPAASVDAIVTDPPYGLGFMGKAWDDLPPGLDFAREALRVLKPGGHLLAFGGTRTWHRLAVAVEDAGFELRDSIAWLYGSGFPKSLDVSKAIDKAAGATREVLRERSYVMTDGGGYSGNLNTSKPRSESSEITAPATPEAEQWSGWGTALKPAFEPIVVARKPLSGTVAANVLQFGTGALNIDGCRIAHDEPEGKPSVGQGGARSGGIMSDRRPAVRVRETTAASTAGRWPANVVLDADQAAALDEQSGTTRATPHRRNAPKEAGTFGAFKGDDAERQGPSDSGGASRFFYVTGRKGSIVETCDSANTAEPTSSRPSQDGGFAPDHAATKECRVGTYTKPLSSAPSTNATPSKSRPSGESDTPTIPPTDSEYWPAWQLAKPSRNDSPASSAAHQESDTTRTTPSHSSSTGIADATTSLGMSSSTALGDQGLPIDSLSERFRYVAKAPKRERPVVDGVAHPTVKPLALMRWLVRLVTPPGGTVLDPFAGSGTTIEGCPA